MEGFQYSDPPAAVRFDCAPLRAFVAPLSAEDRRVYMCTMIVEKVDLEGSGKGIGGWFKLERANVSFDHPFHASFEHALNIDFVNESQGTSARVAVELSEHAARELVRTILAVLDRAEAGGHLAMDQIGES
jgi:hypothetical protein